MLPLGLTVLLSLAWSWVALAPAHAAIPQYQVSEIRSPQPQSQPGSASASAFGERLRTVGDVNGDGARDVLVSNNNFDRTVNGVVLEDVGRLWIFSGRTRALLHTLEHPDPQANSKFGFWSAAPGDVDGDKVPDVVTSAPSQVVGGVRQGQVYLFSGKTGALLRTVNHPDAPQLNGDFGGNLIAPGDLDGDKVGDFVATASGTTAGAGAAYAFSGATGLLLYRVLNPDAVQKSSFGFGASEIGDVTGDTVGDYQVGSPRFDEGAVVDVGRSYTINGKTGAVVFTLRNPDVESMARFGQSDADGISLGDITGDGKRDIFVDGFLSDDGAFANAGAAYLFNGATGQFIRALRDPTPVSSGSFGASNATAGDIDKDGRPDAIISSRGAIGRVTIFGGAGLTQVLGSFGDPQAQLNALFGTGIASPGDVNGDKAPDFFISARSADLDGVANVGIVYAYMSVPPPVYPLPRPGNYPLPSNCAPGTSTGVTCQPLPGGGRRITGTAGNDTIVGTAGNDVINCGAGDDVVSGGAGNDTINCGAGNDRINGNSGDDRLFGDSGNDRLSGDSGNDSDSGGSGSDRASGGSGRDRINGNSGNDVLSGNSSNDSISGSTGRDRIAGGSGNDRVSGNSGNDRVSGDAGRDRINGGSGRDRLSGGSGNDSISARDRARDRVSCGSGRDRASADRRRIDRVSRNCERVRRR